MNWIFSFLIVASVLVAAFTGNMGAVTAAAIASARSAVDLVIGLVGQMALWLGLLGILQASGVLRTLALALAPLLGRLFPGVPKDHPAMGAMVMNLTANLLGLGNAATPFGLKAMRELNKLNALPGVATNAMALFLALNTAGLQLLPVTAIAVRSSAGSRDPAGIIAPTLLASLAGTVVAVLVAKLLERRTFFAAVPLAEGAPGVGEGADSVPEAARTESAGQGSTRSEDSGQGSSRSEAAGQGSTRSALGPSGAADREEVLPENAVAPARGLRLWLGVGVALTVVFALVRHLVLLPSPASGFERTQQVLSDWLVPLVMLGIVLLALGRRVKVYEVAVAGAREALQVAVMIVPFLVLLLVAIGIFRASGALEVIVTLLAPVTGPVGLPAEAVPMALMRSFSGSGSLAVMTETMQTHGADSFLGYLVSTIYGSSETTFYVLAVYFGSVQVRATRHTLPACLAADAAGVAAAVGVCRLFFT